MYIYSKELRFGINVYISHQTDESRLHHIIHSCLGVLLWNFLIETDYGLPQGGECILHELCTYITVELRNIKLFSEAITLSLVREQKFAIFVNISEINNFFIWVEMERL